MSKTATDQFAALAELVQLLAQHDVPYWLFGGWAVDFHAGRVTREHDDIDIAVWANDFGRLSAPFDGAAWQHRSEAYADGYTSYERRGVRLEVAFLARDPDAPTSQVFSIERRLIEESNT